MLTVTVHDRVGDVDAEPWDALGSDPFSSHAMLAVLERAKLPGVCMRYAMISDWTDRLVAAAPITRIGIDGGKLTHGFFRSLIGLARKGYDGFLRTSLMVCGTPLSVGNPPIRMANGVDRCAIVKQLAGLLHELGDAEDAPWRVFKEFGGNDLSAANLALLANRQPWLFAPSEPNASIEIGWQSYDEYLGGLRSHYRYKIRSAARKLEREGVSVEVVSLGDVFDEKLHGLYNAVLHRAAVQFEVLTPDLFVNLGRAYGDAAPLIVFRREGRVIGWVAMLLTNGTAYDLFHGIDYEQSDETALYFNQIAAVVRLAIERGASRLSLGQSTEVAKARFGARSIPLWIGLQHRNPTVTAMLRGGRRVLFPEKVVPERHVFRCSAANAGEVVAEACCS